MKAIIYHAVDPFNEEYSWCEICNDEQVEDTISKAKHLCTEIENYEVYDAYDKRNQ